MVIVTRRKGADRAHQAKADADSRNPASQAQHEAFGEGLAQQTRRRSTHGEADGNLLRTCGSLGEQQIGDVGAGDEEDEAYSDLKNEYGPAGGGADIFDKDGKEVDGEPGVEIGIFFFSLLRNDHHFCAGARDRRPVFETSDDEKVAVVDRAGFRWALIERKPDLGLLLVEALGHRGQMKTPG